MTWKADYTVIPITTHKDKYISHQKVADYWNTREFILREDMFSVIINIVHGESNTYEVPTLIRTQHRNTANV